MRSSGLAGWLAVAAFVLLALLPAYPDILLLENGKRLEGKVLTEDGSFYVLETVTGTITVPRGQVTRRVCESDGVIWTKRGDYWIRHKQTYKALAAYLNALETGEELPHARRRVQGIHNAEYDKRWNHVRHLMDRRLYSRALRELEALIQDPGSRGHEQELKDTMTQLHGILSDQSLEHGERPLAIAHLQAVSALKPRRAEVQKRIGDLYFQEARFPQALTSYEAARGIDPALPGLAEALARVLRRLPEPRSISPYPAGNLVEPRRTFPESPAPAVPPGRSHFEHIIAKHAVRHRLSPHLVTAVIQAESGFDPRAVSSKGACGLMQLMPETARELGVKDVFDPEQNIAGGSRYLSQLLKKNGGSIRLALAAYNAGPTAVKRFGGIPPYRQTRTYVRRVMGYYNGGR